MPLIRTPKPVEKAGCTWRGYAMNNSNLYKNANDPNRNWSELTAFALAMVLTAVVFWQIYLLHDAHEVIADAIQQLEHTHAEVKHANDLVNSAYKQLKQANELITTRCGVQ